MNTRIAQLAARYIGVALAAAAGLLLGRDLSPDEQAQIADLATPIALTLTAAVSFLVDLVLHRLRERGARNTPIDARSLGLVLGMGALLALSVTGFACASPTAVDARAIKTLTDPILLEYDGYVATDAALDPADKALRLRSSEILRDTIDRAAAPTPGSAPAP